MTLRGLALNVGTDAGITVNSVGTTGKNVLNLEFCAGAENSVYGLFGASAAAVSVARYSNCVFANNGSFGVARLSSGTFESRGNNTITGNGTAPTSGAIIPLVPL